MAQLAILEPIPRSDRSVVPTSVRQRTKTFKPAEIAAMTALSPHTIRDLIDANTIDAYRTKVGHKERRVPAESLLYFLNSHPYLQTYVPYWFEQTGSDCPEIEERFLVGHEGLEFHVPQRALPTGEVAKLTSLSQQTIIRHIESGLLQGYRIPGSDFRKVSEGALAGYVLRHNLLLSNELLKNSPVFVDYPGTWEEENQLERDNLLIRFKKQPSPALSIIARDRSSGVYINRTANCKKGETYRVILLGADSPYCNPALLEREAHLDKISAHLDKAIEVFGNCPEEEYNREADDLLYTTAQKFEFHYPRLQQRLSA